jgi:hypothetical protein
MVTVNADIFLRVCFEVAAAENDPYVALTYSESPEFADRYGDATTDRLARDLPLYFTLNNGTNCLGRDYVRGGFKYLTFFMPDEGSPKDGFDGFWHTGMSAPQISKESRVLSFWSSAQKYIGIISSSHGFKNETKPRVAISAVWVNCTAFPSNPNPRAYTGYFDSSSTILNRIWYAGAYTLQLSTLDPKEGSALIDYNRHIDHNDSPTGSWYSNLTIAPGNTVTTDGAKRDRMVWPGDMSIAAPGIAVTTYDMLAVRNALDTLFNHQYSDGSLPYAGPPMGDGGEFSDTYHLHTLLGVFNYVLYSGDLNWLQENWFNYIRALEISVAKVDDVDLLHVSSGNDWLRPGMTGHNGEASAILHEVLYKSVMLAHFLGDDRDEAQPGGNWMAVAARLKHGMEKIYCPRTGLFADNIGRRNCGGVEEVFPQDGNSWLLLTRILEDNDARVYNISENLRKRWTKYGAPAVEYPNVISPFATSFELLGHCAAENHDAAVELMEMMWGYMLDGPGMTNSTMCEGYRADGYAQYPAYWSPARGSHAHGWSTGPTMALLIEILGIKLTSPMGRIWQITPHLTKWLSYAQGGFATRMGKFEVKLKRMRDSEDREALVLEVITPPDTIGDISWGGRMATNVQGGKYKFATMLDSPGAEWIDLADESWKAMSDEELAAQDWPRMSERGFIPDDQWVKPPHEERQPGVVDWEAMERNYINGHLRKGSGVNGVGGIGGVQEL